MHNALCATPYSMPSAASINIATNKNSLQKNKSGDSGTIFVGIQRLPDRSTSEGLDVLHEVSSAISRSSVRSV